MKVHPALALLTATCLAGTAAGAPAGDSDTLQVRSATVQYDASQVQDRKSAEKLFFRIRQAAEEVCRISSYPRGYEIWYEHDCEAEAVSDAVQQADIQALNDFYHRRSGEAATVDR